MKTCPSPSVLEQLSACRSCNSTPELDVAIKILLVLRRPGLFSFLSRTFVLHWFWTDFLPPASSSPLLVLIWQTCYLCWCSTRLQVAHNAAPPPSHPPPTYFCVIHNHLSPWQPGENRKRINVGAVMVVMAVVVMVGGGMIMRDKLWLCFLISYLVSNQTSSTKHLVQRFSTSSLNQLLLKHLPFSFFRSSFLSATLFKGKLQLGQCEVGAERRSEVKWFNGIGWWAWTAAGMRD